MKRISGWFKTCIMALLACLALTSVAAASEDQAIEWEKNGREETGLEIISETRTVVDDMFVRPISVTYYGLKAADGTVVLPAEYVDLEYVGNDRIICRRNIVHFMDGGDYSVVDTTGRTILGEELKAEYIKPSADQSAFLVHFRRWDDENSCSLYDWNGNLLLSKDQYAYIEDLKNGCFKIQQKPKQTGIYQVGAGVTVPCIYRMLHPIDDNPLLFAAMNPSGRCGVITADNQQVLPMQYDIVLDSMNGVFQVGIFTDAECKQAYYDNGFLQTNQTKYDYYFVNAEGNIVLPVLENKVAYFDHHFLYVKEWDGTYVKSRVQLVGGDPVYEKHMVTVAKYKAEDLTPVKFYDVDLYAYYFDAVQWGVEQGIVYGTSETQFSPNATCTNAQILSYMWRAAGSPEPQIANPFSNVNGDEYYAKAAVWAYEQGMITGREFPANQNCTRAMTMEYFWKQSGRPSAGPTSKFTDVPANASYAEAVAWAVTNGITFGTSDDTFSPDLTCTRAQIISYLYRAMSE